MFKLLMKANYLYSTLWIKFTGKDKFQYREESCVHHFLVQKAFEIVAKPVLLNK
ncbi:MAG: hypothetical protein HFG83_01540 [Dorea sp.]|jgi:hypothetical protein|nr:hypothetical protein [Dorea sp.]